MAPGEPPDRNDPFEGLQLDEAFVQGATVSELPADVRIERLRRIDQQHRQLAGDRTEQHHALYRHEQQQRRRRWLAALSLLVVVGLALSWSALRSRAGQVSESLDDIAPGLVLDDGKSSSVGQGTDRPSPSPEEQSKAIGAPAAAPAGTGPFVFMATQPGSDKPVAYDPCRPIHVVVNTRTAPAGIDRVFQRSLERVSDATGLRFILDGATTEEPVDDRPAFQFDRYGDRWAPVLVAWTDATTTPALAGSIAGDAGSQSIQLTDRAVYVTGVVRLDGPGLQAVFGTPNGAADVQAVIEHELGHLVGLDHVEDPSQLMNPSTDGHVTDYADGDLLGLRRLGQGACFPDV